MHSLKFVALLALVGLALSQSCGGTIYDTYAYGTLYSPSSGGMYPASAYCDWSFDSVYNGAYTGVKFTFDNIYIEQGYDYINIYENGDPTASFTGNVTGTYTASTTNVQLIFTSDSVVQYPSFSIGYQWVNVSAEPCGGTVFSNYGVIYGPADSTGDYPADANCTWYFPQYETWVAMDFNNLVLESDYDFIYIYTGYNNELYATLTGSLGYYSIEVPAPATVVFVSDYSNEFDAFTMEYEYTWDAPSDSDSGSSSSSNEPYHRGIVVVFIVTAFLLGCIGGLVLGICIFTRNRARQQKQAEIPMNHAGYVPLPMYQMMQVPMPTPQVPQQI